MTTTAPAPAAATVGGIDPNEIVVAGFQRILVAPVGTAIPASIDEPPGTGWVDLGYTTEDGLAASFGKETDTLMTSQSLDPVRMLVTGAPKTLTASLRQLNAETLTLALGGGTVTGDDEAWEFEPAPASYIDERALMIEAEDGDTKVRIVYYRTMITEAVEFTFVNTEGLVFPLTFSVLSHEPSTFKVQGTAPGFAGGASPAEVDVATAAGDSPQTAQATASTVAARR